MILKFWGKSKCYCEKTAEVGAPEPAIMGRDGLYAYLRRTDDAPALCVLNTSAVRIRRTLALPQTLAEAGTLIDALSGKRLAVQSGAVMLSLAPGEGRVLIR